MEQIQRTLESLHSVTDDFTISLFTVAVLVDLAASLFSQRLWLRHAALLLTILAAVSAVGSFYTGRVEAERVSTLLTGAVKDILNYHRTLGQALTYGLGALAVFRIALAIFGFLARLRPLYLILAVAAVVAVFFETYLGSTLVYTYGVGTKPGERAMSQPLGGSVEEMTKQLIKKLPAPPAESSPGSPTPSPALSKRILTPMPTPEISPTSASPGAAAPTSSVLSTPEVFVTPTPEATPVGSPTPSGEGVKPER